MLQPRESRLLWRRRKRRHSMEGLCCSRIYSTLIIIGCLTSLPQGLTQHNDDIYIVKPTPALRFGKEELTTVLLVNNENHGRYINVRPEVGLLTSTARTFIQEGVTTEYATQVVGTTLDNGRVYAQYLKKSSRVLYDGGSAVPSVVTSWVGESLHSEGVFLPQSHNDLFDADQPDWQAIDDRLLGDRRHHDDFVGNTDYVGLRSKSSSATSSQGEIKSLGITSSLGYTPNSKSSYDFVTHLGENARKVAANKVLPIGDLPTYTIKQNYEPSAYLTSNDDVGLEEDNDEEAFGRNPKLIYKKLMQNHVRSENESSSVLQAPKPLIPFSRHFATVTYYGFADFTTVVGDSVIVFSPSTSTHNVNYQAQVTSIKGEATLGSGLPQGPSITKVPITIAQDIIEPTIAQRPSITTSLDAPIATTMEMDTDLEETSSTSSSTTTTTSTTTAITISSEKTEVQQESVTVLETSEVVVQATQSEMSSIETTLTTAPVMLSRPSDEEILRIYNALANANVEADKVQIQSTTAVNTTIITDASSADDEVQLKTSSVETFGGATTIFFEDDPFANFVDATKTQTSINLDSTAVTQNMSTSLSESSTFSVKESDEVPTSTSQKPIEVSTEESKSETTTDAALTSSEIILDTTTSNTITTPAPNTQHSNQDANSPADILPNVLIKEIDPNNEEVPQDCISTSQVFLTQLPKTVTQTETVVITVNESELRTEIKQQIQPTFEIKEATKYYCIQASQIQANQIESPLVKATISALENKDQHLATVDVTEVNEEDVTETFVSTTTEETSVADKTEQPDVDEKKEDITKPTGLATSAELEVDENEQEEDGDEEASGQAEDEEEDDEEIELIYKTLYTTYTYLTTFFHDESTSISSHTEVVTNVMTSTLGISSTKESASTYIIANVDDNEINPTGSLAVTTQMETTKRYVVPSEVESFIRTDEIETDADIVDNSYVSSKSSESLTTFYTTYTYYTTIFAEGETDIMSHTEIITNVKKSATSATSEAERIMPTISSYSASAKEEDIATTIYQGEEEPIREIESSSMSRSANLASNDKALLPDIPELGDLSAITLITDVRSSSSPGDKQIINNISSPAKISNDTVLPQQQSILEDQISSESNTDTDEIIPSATLLLQTSFTTFTYYTTMYSGDETNVISRLETMTNTVTETLKPSKTIDLKGASLPITYFTTFTYWTKLAKEGQITTLSREEIISNVIVPTMVQPETQDTQTQIESLETTINKDSDTVANMVTETTLTEETTLHGVQDENVLNQANQAELTTNISAGQHITNILEPTTYYTTYTYYTTSYEADKTITDSRFETATNIVTPTVTLANTKEPNEDSAKLEKPLSSSVTPSLQSQINFSDASTSELLLYDFKKIIDADGISTIFFTTEIKPTLNSDGVLTEVISSTSSLLINEEKRSIQVTEALESSVNTLGVEGQMQKQYKTGLVRLIEGTRIANRTTTLYQSKVIGTVIDQRYAQIIESTSSFIFEKTRAPEDSNSLNLEILPTSSSDVQNIQPTQQVSLESSISLPKVEGSITETSSEVDIEISTKPAEEVDEENYSKTDEKLRFPFQTKKPPFISPLKPFSNRNRPQFAPKKNSSATIITRSDFTPTITATPALKTISRFSSTRRGSVSSNSVSFASSSRRFGRPSKSSVAGSGLQAASTQGQAASRNRFASSSSARGSFASSSRRLGGSSNTVRPSFSRPSLFSSGFSGNSRLRVRPTSIVDIGEASSAIDIATSGQLNSQEDGGGVSQAQDDLEDDEENATESNRKQNNPLLRLRRPLNRPQGFTPARPQANSPNNAVSLRRNPLINRGRSSNVASLTSTTTTTTAKPKPRTFQPPLIAQNRQRPTNSLFPPRNIFGAQKVAVTTEENKDLSEEDTNENNDDSEYEDDDDEESEGDDEEESNRRRRRSHNNTELAEKHKLRNKREADSAQQNRSNFRNRFRRPKLASHAQSESKSAEDETSEAKEPATTGVPASTTATQRTRTRFGARYSQHSSSSTTSATTSGATSNHKAIRPTRPTSNGRAQFTLRDKDSSAMSTTQKGLTTAKRPAFRRPQPGGTHGTRRLPSSTAPSSSSSSSSSGKRRLKSFTNNDSTTTSRNSVTGRSRPSSTTSGRSRVSSPSRDSNIGGRNRARNNHNYNSNNNNNNEPLIFDNSGTITVTHVIPTEVTIPVVNGKVTEYKQVVTAKTSTEVLDPQQYTTTIAANGLPQLALTREDSSVNYNGATEVTQYVLHETPTTTITFTPTTIRGRKTSFSHVLPSTVYSVEQVVSTVQPQISANAPLANILLSQLLLGNVGLQAGNPLLGALGGALSQPGVGLGTAVGPAQPATPVTEYKTHASTYVTTVVEGQSTVLPITFQGKKILTTIFDTTAQTITATEFITDTIVTTPTALVQAQPAVNSLLLQQLLLQQHLQQQQQQLQQPTPDPSYPLNAILNSVPPQFLLGGDNLQELEASNNIRGSGQSDLLNDDDDFTVGSSVDLDDIALQAQAQTHKTGRKKTRKNGKNHKRKQNNNGDGHGAVESSVITLYVSGRRPGEFSTVLSTVQVRPDSTQYKRHAHTIDTETDYLNDGSELVHEYLALPPEIVLLDGKDKHENEVVYENEGVATQSLESIVGDVSLWYSTQTTTTSTADLSKVSATDIAIDSMAESPRLSVDSHVANSTSPEIRKQFEHFDSGQEEPKADTFVQRDAAALKSSYDYRYPEDYNDNNSNNGQSQNDDMDEARYNLATRIMSNGVEVIIASDKTKTPDRIVPDVSNNQQHYNKPMTLAASTIKNQMMIFLFPSSLTPTDYQIVVNQSKQLDFNLPFHTNHFITKTCLTTYTYRTTYIHDGRTTVESREKVISNIATEERNYPKITPSQTLGVTLTRTPELAVGIFPTTYSYFNTFKDNNNKVQVMSSEHTVVNTITGPNDYVAYLQPTAKATADEKTNTYFNEVTVTLSPMLNSKIQTFKRNLTQVVITKSYLPPHSTSVLTSYYAFDNINDSEDILNSNFNLPNTSVKSSVGEKEEIDHDGDHIDKTNTLQNLHIYATKTFLTTFTYYTTTVLNSYVKEPSQTELSVKPMSTAYNYYTRVIENVITDSVPASLLSHELLANMKIELKRQTPNQRDRQRIIVTTATLKDGQTVKISAMEMYKSNLASSSSLPLSATVDVLQQDLVMNPEATADNYQTPGEDATTDDFQLQESASLGILPIEEQAKYPTNQESFGEENSVIASSPSEQILSILDAQNPEILPTNVNISSVNSHPTSAANQLIQRLTALKPMFNAMADLLQNNFGANRDMVKPIKTIESKQAANKKINSNSTMDTMHPIYIPVQKSPLLKNNLYEISNHSEFTPQSLHIKPPLRLNEEGQFEANNKENYANLIPLATLTAPMQEQPLHNGGIYIRPGEIITANSDVIVGKPNGIEYVQIPHQYTVDKNTSKAYTLNNRQFQVTYYHNQIQHPYKKKSSAAINSPITHRPQHIPIIGGLTGNNFSPQPSMRPQNDLHFNKNILKPPPPPPPPTLHQSHIPLHTQPGLSLSLTAPDKPKTSNKPLIYNTPLATESATSTLQSHLQLPTSRHKITEHKPSPSSAAINLRATHNFYNLNNDLKNNEILEIQKIPQVFSADLKPNTLHTTNLPKLSNINRKTQNQPHLSSAHNNVNTEINLSFDKKPTTSESYQNSALNERESQTSLTYQRFQPKKEEISGEYLTNLNGQDTQIKPQNFPSHRQVDSATNFAVMEQATQMENANPLKSSMELIWNLQHGVQAPKNNKFSTHLIQEKPNTLLNYANKALSSNVPNTPTNFLTSPSKGNLHYKPSIKKLNNPTNFLISPSNGNLPYKQSGLNQPNSPTIFLTSPSNGNLPYNPSGSIIPNTSPNFLTSSSNGNLPYKSSSSNLPNTPYKFLISPSNENLPYKPSAKQTSQQDKPKSKQNIVHSNNNDSWTKNHQNVSLHQHVFSHTVDVNVPPLTFNREDLDYPQQAATAVRGQIPYATVNELKTPAKPLYKYMPLITIPAHEQQVQVSLTPLNMMGTLTSPIEEENETPIKQKSAGEDSNNIVRKISLPNNNFQIYENDQKTVATTNILSVKPKQDTTSNSKQNRRQHNTTSRPADTTRRQTPEKKSKTEQHLKTTVQPNGIHQQTTNKTIQHLVQVHSDIRYPYLSLGPSIPQESMAAVNSQLYSTKANDTDWLISQDYAEKEYERNLTSKPQKTDLNEEAFSIIKPNREKYRATRVSIPKTNVFANKSNKSSPVGLNIQNAQKQATDERTTAEDINEIMNSLKTENEDLNAVQLVTQGKPFRKSINYYGQQTEDRNTERQNQTKMAAIFVAPGEAFRTNKPTNRHKEMTEIFVTRESQYLAPQQTGQTKKIFNKTATESSGHTAKPIEVDRKPWTSKISNASTEPVFGFQPPPPPPPLTTLTSSHTTITQTNFTNYSLTKIQNKTLEMIGKRQPIKTSDNRQAVNSYDKLIPNTTFTDTTVNDQQIVGVPDKSYTGYNITTTKTINDIKHTIPTANGTIKYFENEGRKRNDSFQMVYLLPSESYKEKISSTTTTPLKASLFTFTTTTTTTTTIKRIILPTKYVTNKRIYTVTTTASNQSPPIPHTTYIQSTTSFLSTTETTTEVSTLFLTHTQINTIIDTVTSVKTLEPITVTATSITTTTHKPSTSTNSRLATLASVASQAYDFNPDSVTSTETHTHELNKGLTYLPYPSVEVVSANISQESTLNPDENSIFIIMTNQKNKNNIFAQSPSPPQYGNKIPQQLTEDNDIAQADESNDLIIEYDNGITFDDIPTIRDEEPGQIINGKSVFSSGTDNHVAVAVKENSSDDQLILGGVLIATPPKSPTEHIQLNDSSSDSCLPKCKASRNEQCVLVDNHWSCFCRPGFARMFPDRPCKPTYTYALLMHAERVGNYPLQYVNELTDNKTEHYKQLSQLIINALDRMIMQSDFRDSYHGVEVTEFDDDHKSHQGILINILLQLSDNSNEKRLEEVFKKHLRLSNYSIGGTDIYTNKAGVDALAIKDFNECLTKKLHDCSENANCFNLPGTYTCSCVEGFADISDNPIYPGRICSSEQIGCEMCHYHGKCFHASTTEVANSIDRSYCECFPWYAGFKCQVNLKILLIVLLGIGTLLFILLLFCILITCTKRRSHLQHTALAPSTATSSSVDLQKNSRMAANMLITSVGLHSSSLQGVGGSLKNNKRQKSIKIDKRSMIKDSSSETSQNSLPYALKNRDLISESGIKKKGCLNHSKKCRNGSSLGVNTMEQYSGSVPSNVQAENPSELNTVITTSSSSFKGNQCNQQSEKNLLGNAGEFEGHYCEQSDRSLTVMIPRAKYHSSVLSQTQLMHHQLTMERIYKTAKPENKFMNVEKGADAKRNYKKNVSTAREITDEEKRIEIPANPGALISAGFEVSAIVRDNNTTSVNTMEQKNNDLVRFDSIPQNYTIITTSDPATSIDSNSGQKALTINEDRQHFTANKKCSTNESDYNVYKCEKDLIETMDEWLGNIKLNELSAEARSFDETTIRASTKPLRTSIDGTQTQRLHDEVNTMAERDLGSTFLLPHTHLYKPERQDTELSGFDSF